MTDVYPDGGSWCFNEHTVGWSGLPFQWSSFTLPADGECGGAGGDLPGSIDGEDVFAITIDVGKIKKRTVELTYTTE